MAEDPELAEAIRQSMLESKRDEANAQQDHPMPEDDDDDEFARAMALSQLSADADRANDQKKPLLADQKEAPKEPAPAEAPSEDSEYLSSLLLSLPGVDPNDPEVQAMLEQMKKEGGQ